MIFQKFLKLKTTKTESVLGNVLTGKSEQMKKLHVLVSHQYLNEKPTMSLTEVTITEKGLKVEDREDEENDSTHINP